MTAQLLKTLLLALGFLAPATVLAERLDLPGRSYGGKVRSGPSLNHTQIGSTRLNDRIVLIERSARMDDFDWFVIQMPNGQLGYQWGGLMCADGEISGVLTICGSHQDAELSGLPAAATGAVDAVFYSCNEGIPLVVRFGQEGNQDVAYASHDSFPEVRLVQVPSGSGVQYQAGNYWMGGKGREMMINFDGIEDSCEEDN